MPHVIPTTVAGVVVDHPVGSFQLIRRMRKTGNQHNRDPDCPSQPTETTGKPNKEIGMFEPPRALLQRPITCFVLGPVGNVVPNQSNPMGRLLVDADHAVSGLLQEGDDLGPATRIVPILALSRALYCDTYVRFRDGSRIIVQHDAWRYFAGIYSQYITPCAVETDVAKIAGLEHEISVVKKQTHRVGCIVTFWLHLRVGCKCN